MRKFSRVICWLTKMPRLNYPTLVKSWMQAWHSKICVPNLLADKFFPGAISWWVGREQQLLLFQFTQKFLAGKEVGARSPLGLPAHTLSLIQVEPVIKGEESNFARIQ